MFKIHKEELEINGKKLTLETGKIARQADGAIIATCGETVVIATTVGRSLTVDVADFDSIPAYTLSSPIEYPFYIVLGIIIGLAAAIFIKLMNFVEDNIEKFDNVPVPIRTALGGLCVGLIALSFPHVLGNGFDVTSDLISLDTDEKNNVILGDSFPSMNH